MPACVLYVFNMFNILTDVSRVVVPPTSTTKNKKEKRHDLLGKMMNVDDTAATEEEKRDGITKLRYMRFREEQSTSVSLGFRLEAMHVSAEEQVSTLMILIIMNSFCAGYIIIAIFRGC